MYLTKDNLLTSSELEEFAHFLDCLFQRMSESTIQRPNLFVAENNEDALGLASYLALVLHDRFGQRAWQRITNANKATAECNFTATYYFLFGDLAYPPFVSYLEMSSYFRQEVLAKCRYYFKVKGPFEERVAIYERLESGKGRLLTEVTVEQNKALLASPRLNFSSGPLLRGRQGFVDIIFMVASPLRKKQANRLTFFH